MYQESEIVDLLMVLFLTPIMAASVRAIHIPAKKTFVAGYLAVVVGYVFTVAEGFVLAELFNLLEHVSYAAGGILFAIAAVRLARATRVGEMSR